MKLACISTRAVQADNRVLAVIYGRTPLAIHAQPTNFLFSLDRTTDLFLALYSLTSVAYAQSTVFC